jgi:hypothetical protein
VDLLSRRGADFVKAYEMLRRDTFFALVEQAKKSGLPVVAHVPLAVLAGEASDAGVRSFEHLRNIEFACSREADALLAERIALLEAGAGRIGAELRAKIHSAQRARSTPTMRSAARLCCGSSPPTVLGRHQHFSSTYARCVVPTCATMCGRRCARCRIASAPSGRHGRSESLT